MNIDIDRARASGIDGLPPSGTLSIPRGGRPSVLASDSAFADTRFAVLHEIARGGMGRVLAATDRLLGRRVAIKVALANDVMTQQRLGREAAILSSLCHPSVPPIYELGWMRGGRAYFVTRFVDGDTFETHLRGRIGDDWRAALAVIAQVADVMEAVHRSGVIHRDLKPSNVLIDRQGEPVIIDWGIARRIRPLAFDPGIEALHDLDLTSPGTAIGTPGYWSPEQRRGEPGSPLSDVYSLGAIAFRAFVGWPARDAIGGALDTAPSWLRDLITTAMAPAPSDRFASAAAFADAVRRRVLRIDPRPRARRWRFRRARRPARP